MKNDDAVMLAQAAIAARKNAYAPYSGFLVGAALLADDGRVFSGCNVENAAYGVTLCAERCALAKAVSEGARRFVAIAVAGAPGGVAERQLPPCPPCGSCRQALFEFGGEDLAVILALGEGRYTQSTLGQLLPMAFGPAVL